MASIGVKYCGGCNPRYDRRALTARLRRSFPEHDFREGMSAQTDDFAPDLALVLNGCSSACAEHGGFTGKRGKIVIDAPEGYEAIEAALLNLSLARAGETGRARITCNQPPAGPPRFRPAAGGNPPEDG